MNDLISSSAQMTSLEIADLVEKRHDNVKRTIETIAEKGTIVLPQIEDVPFVDESGRNRTTSAYIFSGEQGKRDSIIVVAQLSPAFTARLVDRWQALESGEATPAFRLEPQNQPRRATPDTNIAALKLSRTAMAAAKAFGLKGNQAALSADHAIRAITGTSPLVLLGQTHLSADPRGQTYTPTELGKMMVEPLSPHKTNKLLEEKGMQIHDIKDSWTPTDKGKKHCEWLDTNKRHSDGTPVKQLKWFASVLDAMGVEYRLIGEDAA